MGVGELPGPQTEGSITSAVLAQSQALVALVSHLSAGSSDPLLEVPGQATSIRGSVNRARFQQELASRTGAFAQKIRDNMARRMDPTQNATGGSGVLHALHGKTRRVLLPALARPAGLAGGTGARSASCWFRARRARRALASSSSSHDRANRSGWRKPQSGMAADAPIGATPERVSTARSCARRSTSCVLPASGTEMDNNSSCIHERARIHRFPTCRSECKEPQSAQASGKTACPSSAECSAYRRPTHEKTAKSSAVGSKEGPRCRSSAKEVTYPESTPLGGPTAAASRVPPDFVGRGLLSSPPGLPPPEPDPGSLPHLWSSLGTTTPFAPPDTPAFDLGASSQPSGPAPARKDVSSVCDASGDVFPLRGSALREEGEFSLESWIAALPRLLRRGRTQLSRFLLSTLNLPRGFSSPTAALFPLPLSREGIFLQRACRDAASRRRLAVQRCTHLVAMCLNFMHAGCKPVPLRFFAEASFLAPGSGLREDCCAGQGVCPPGWTCSCLCWAS